MLGIEMLSGEADDVTRGATVALDVGSAAFACRLSPMDDTVACPCGIAPSVAVFSIAALFCCDL